MWRNKKPDSPQAADREPKNVQTNRPSKSAAESGEETIKTSRDVIRPTGATADRPTGWLGSSLHVKGEISGKEDLYIEGTVEGSVQLAEGRVTVGMTAEVTADIIAREVVVYGNVRGNVRAKGRIEIKKDGSVNGDLMTPQIMIEDGAYFKGSIEIERSAEREANKNVSSGTTLAAKAASASQKTT